MRRVLRCGFQRRDDHVLDLIGGDAGGPAGPGIIEQPVQPVLQKPAPPLGHGMRFNPAPCGHGYIRQALRTAQDDA